MEKVKNGFLDWLAKRAQERTTAAGLAVLASWFGWHIAPDLLAQWLGVIGSALVLMNTSGS